MRGINQRWAESEKLTPKPDPKTLVSLQSLNSESGSVPIFAMLLHTFYITVPFIPNLDPSFPKNSNPDTKNIAGLQIRSVQTSGINCT